MTKLTFTDTSCVFSDDRLYRYSLRRKWLDDVVPQYPGYVAFVGLNPSKADETRLDNTVSKCIRFAHRWGFHSMQMLNLFAYRATHPLDMMKHAQPIGDPAMDHQIFEWLNEARRIVLCWGNHGVHMKRSEFFLGRLQAENLLWKCHAFKITNASQPIHPLYLSEKSPLFLLSNMQNELSIGPEVSDPVKAEPIPKVRMTPDKPYKPKVYPLRTPTVYIMDVTGLEVTDSVVVKSYSVVKKHKKGVTVAVHGGTKYIMWTRHCLGFFSETTAAQYLQGWLKNKREKLTKHLGLVDNLSKMTPEGALKALLTVTDP